MNILLILMYLHRERERERDRETETERQTDRQTEREREFSNYCLHKRRDGPRPQGTNFPDFFFLRQAMAAMLEEKNSLEQEKAALIREGSSAQAAVAQVCMCMDVCVWMYIYMYVYTYVHVYYVLTNLPIPSSRCKYIKKK